MKDYANRFNRPKSQERTTLGARPPIFGSFNKLGFGFILGTLISIFIVLVVIYLLHQKDPSTVHPEVAVSTTTPVSKTKTTQSTTSLPVTKATEQNKALTSNQKVSSSKNRVTKLATKPKQPVFDFYTILPNQSIELDQDQAVGKNRQFMVQVAAYKDKDVANKMKVKLLLMGLNPSISQNQSGWYRVEMGPFKTLREGDKIRHILQKANINDSFIRQLPNAT